MLLLAVPVICITSPISSPSIAPIPVKAILFVELVKVADPVTGSVGDNAKISSVFVAISSVFVAISSVFWSTSGLILS